MPELPEVETIRRALEKPLCGRTIIGVKALCKTLREPLDSRSLTRALKGQTILAVRRRAKFLLLQTSPEQALLIHLGMTGSLRIEPEGFTPRKHDRVVIRLDKQESLVYNDIRKFGIVKTCKLEGPGNLPAELSGYGPEPLERQFNTAYLQKQLERSKGPVKPFIMKQEVVVRVGNIYASEALFLCGIDPLRAGNTLSAKECAGLVKAIKAVLRQSLKSGGTTFSDYRRPDGTEGQFALRLKAYNRSGQPCVRKGCNGTIRKITQTGRSTFYCPDCQK